MRECENKISIVGILKSKNVKRATKDGVNTISVDLVVQSKLADNKINEVKVGFYAKEGSKLYTSYNAVANEYKTIAENGTGDKVKITGSISMNEFLTKDGEFVSRNRLRGLFCNRLDAGDTTPHSCGAVVECVVLGVMDDIKNGMLTGRKKVQAYTVGYQDSVIEIKDLFVADHLSTQFSKLYTPNSTGRLFIEINNYAVVEEATNTNVATGGFGSQLSVMPETVTNFVNEYIIIGGDMPMISNKFTLQDIEAMKQNRNVVINKIMSTPPTPKTETTSAPSGFGSGFGDSTPSFADDNIPF